MPYTAMSHLLWLIHNNCVPELDDGSRTRFNLHHGEGPIFSAGAVTLAEEQTVNTGSRTYGGLSLPVEQECTTTSAHHRGTRYRA